MKCLDMFKLWNVKWAFLQAPTFVRSEQCQAHLRNMRFRSFVVKRLFLVAGVLFLAGVLLAAAPLRRRPTPASAALAHPIPTSLHHIVFGIASSAVSWPRRRPCLRLWWPPNATARGFVFLDRLPDAHADPADPTLRVSEDTSRFPYTFPRGLRSAVRVARIVVELVADLKDDDCDTRWIVFGDDDTVFVPGNLVRVLSKYDHRRWYYVGSNSESVEQNAKYSFDMAFGGGGFALSYPLARALAGVMDSCLVRYAHLYGSDARIYSCLAELGVRLTHEAGFHQVDVRGDLFGLLSAHPLAPLVSLHHLDYVEPIFPNMNLTQALKRLFEAIHVDSVRILQQSICYDLSNSITLSVSWGYSVSLYEGNILLPDLLASQKTFFPWKRTRNLTSSQYMFKTRDFPRNPCARPAIFFLENATSDSSGILSYYNGYFIKKCTSSKSLAYSLELIRIFSQKEELDITELQTPRRQCCDVQPYIGGKILEISLRKCKDGELSTMG